MVLPGPLTSGATYRDDSALGGAIVVSGTQRDLAAAASARLAGLDTFVIAVSWLASAPLIAAAAAGLVF